MVLGFRISNQASCGDSRLGCPATKRRNRAEHSEDHAL